MNKKNFIVKKYVSNESIYFNKCIKEKSIFLRKNYDINRKKEIIYNFNYKNFYYKKMIMNKYKLVNNFKLKNLKDKLRNNLSVFPITGNYFI